MKITEKLKLNYLERKKIFIFILIAFSIFYIATIYFIHINNKTNLYKNVDIILKSSAYAIEGFISEDFHDRALQADAITKKEDIQNIDALSSYTNSIEIEYLYTMIQKDGNIHFTTSSATDEDFEENLTTYYFDIYESATDILQNTIAMNTIQYEESTDKWGTFRSIFIPMETKNGNKYILGADLDISYIHEELDTFLMQSFILFIFLILLIISIIAFLTKIHKKEHEFIDTVESKLEDEIVLKTEQLNLLNQNLELKVQEKTLELATINKELQQRVTKEVDKNIQQMSKLEQQSKMAAMGEMIGNIAHQWRQPLSVISSAASAMQMEKELGILDDKELSSYCTNIIDNTVYLSNTIDDFRNYIRGDREAIEYNLKDETLKFIKLTNSVSKGHNIQLILELEDDINLMGYPSQLIQCFINIFNNAKDAFEENNIDVRHRYVFISHHLENDKITVLFKDNAGGIPKDILPKIFEPYFTTKHQYFGTGLGLHMSYEIIVNSMDGTIEVTNENYKYKSNQYTGAQFKISLPLSSVELEATPTKSP